MEQLTVNILSLPALLVTLTAAAPAVATPSPVAGGASPPGASVRADTTLAVSRGDRLVLRNFEGRLSVGTSREEIVRIVGQPDEAEPFEVGRSGRQLSVRAPGRHAHGARGPFQVTVPEWLPVEIRGRETDVEVRGLREELEIRTLHGSIRIFDVAGSIEARTVHGEVVAEDVSGRLRLGSVEEDVRVRRGTGDLEIESVDGDVILEEIEAERIVASSVDGDLRLDGRLPAGATYRLTTHDGDLRVELAGSIDAEVLVSTFDGSFESDFPVVLRRFRGGQEMRFTLGDGGAELVLEAFDGDIELRQGGG